MPGHEWLRPLYRAAMMAPMPKPRLRAAANNAEAGLWLRWQMFRIRTLNWPAFHAKAGNWAQIASAVFAFGSMIAAIVGFTIVIWQMEDSRKKTADEAYRAELADARKIYVSYSEAALRYPHLTAPDYGMLMRNHTEYLRYQSFISHMVYAYDDILNVVTHSKENGAKNEWLVAFRADIAPHRRYLCHPADANFTQMFRPTMQTLLNEAAADCAQMEPLVESP
jgi:hypothetical protein